jgi:hypothetical protein
LIKRRDVHPSGSFSRGGYVLERSAQVHRKGEVRWDRGRMEKMEQCVITVVMRDCRIEIIAPGVTALRV